MNYAIRPATTLPVAYLYRDPVDFRKSHRGLAAIVELELGKNPFLCGGFQYVAAMIIESSRYFVFRALLNTRRHIIISYFRGCEGWSP